MPLCLVWDILKLNLKEQKIYMNPEKIRALKNTVELEYPAVVGISVYKNDDIIFSENFGGFSAGDAAHVYSVTKSIVCALVMIALDRGLIAGTDTKVSEFFPERKFSGTAAEVTLEHLLTMTAPYKYSDEPFEEFFMSDNHLSAALEYLGGENPPGTFFYSPIVGAHILSGILVKSTGMSVADFARKNLFEPLGITLGPDIVFRTVEEQMDFYARSKHPCAWVVDPQGMHTASWGLCLTPTDMLKIGILWLKKGEWQGKQIVSRKRIEESTRAQVDLKDISYGYLWWVIDEKKEIYAALGDGGNAIYVRGDKNIAVAVASLAGPDTKDSMELILRHILPAIKD